METVSKVSGAVAYRYYWHSYDGIFQASEIADFLMWSQKMQTKWGTDNNWGGWFEQSADGEPQGEWHDPHGILARFGISHGQQIETAADRALVRKIWDGYCPTKGTGERTKLIRGSIAATDRTYSAPKSVGIIFAAWGAGKDRLVRLARDGAAYASQVTNDLGAASCRLREKVVPTQKASVAVVHGDSRTGNPELHVHEQEFHATFEPTSGTWKSAFLPTTLSWSKTGGSAFRCYEAWGLRQLGFELDLFRDRTGGVMFDIAGVDRRVDVNGKSTSLIRHLSSRRAAIEDAIDARTFASDKALTAYAQQVCLEQRSGKVKKSPSDIMRGWRKQLAGYGVTEATVEALRQAPAPVVLSDDELAERILGELSVHDDVITERTFWRRAFDAGIGMAPPETVERVGRRVLESLVPCGRHRDGSALWATPAALDLQHTVLTEVRGGAFVQGWTPPRSAFHPDDFLLSESARQAVRTALSGHQRLVVVEGGSEDAEAIRTAAASGLQVVEGAHRLTWCEVGELLSGLPDGERLVLVGDRRAKVPDVAGSAFAALSSPPQVAPEALRQAVHVVPDAIAAAAATVVQGRHRSALVLSTSKATVKRVNACVRQGLREQGKIGADIGMLGAPGGLLPVAIGDVVVLSGNRRAEVVEWLEDEDMDRKRKVAKGVRQGRARVRLLGDHGLPSDEVLIVQGVNGYGYCQLAGCMSQHSSFQPSSVAFVPSASCSDAVPWLLAANGGKVPLVLASAGRETPEAAIERTVRAMSSPTPACGLYRVGAEYKPTRGELPVRRTAQRNLGVDDGVETEAVAPTKTRGRGR